MTGVKRRKNKLEEDPLLALYGSGKDLWADEDADEYVRRLREGWDETSELRENPDRWPSASEGK
jgi:hypothetical protein